MLQSARSATIKHAGEDIKIQVSWLYSDNKTKHSGQNGRIDRFDREEKKNN